MAITPTLATIGAFRTWLTQQGFSRNTVRAYVADLRGFLDSVGMPFEKQEVESLVAAWMNHGRNDWEPKTTQRKLTSLRSFANSIGLGPKILPDYRLPRPARRDPNPLDGGIEDVYALLAHAEDDRERAMVALCGLCGLRIGEALNVQPRDIDWMLRQVHVRHGKGDKGRIVPISQDAWDNISPAYFAARLDNVGYVVNLSDRTARRKVTEMGQRAGIDLSSHMLRTTFATEAYEVSDHDIRAVQELLGHEHVTTTQGYVGVRMETMRAAVNFTRPKLGV